MKVKEKDLVLTRVFDAPRERVWKAWTDPRQIAQLHGIGPNARKQLRQALAAHGLSFAAERGRHG